MDSTKWLRIADLLQKQGELFCSEWQAKVPPTGIRESAAIGADCDVWCRRLARNFGEPLNPPEAVKPWLLARLFAFAAVARALAEAPDAPPPPPVTPKTIEDMLIDEWHGRLRDLWPQSERDRN